MPNIHPMFVHFPIALIFVTVAIDFIGLIFKREQLFFAGTVTSLFALAGAITAVITGLIAEDSAWHPASVNEMLDTHELMGFIVLGLIAVLVIFRLAMHDRLNKRMGWIAFGIGAAAVIFVSYGGYLGGEMVYSHGAGVIAAENCLEKTEKLDKEIQELREPKKQAPQPDQTPGDSEHEQEHPIDH